MGKFSMSFRITISWYKKTLFSNNNFLKKKKKKIHHAIKVLKSFTECFKPLGTHYAVTVLTSFCLNKRKILQVNAEADFAAKKSADESQNQACFQGLPPGHRGLNKEPNHCVCLCTQGEVTNANLHPKVRGRKLPGLLESATAARPATGPAEASSSLEN